MASSSVRLFTLACVPLLTAWLGLRLLLHVCSHHPVRVALPRMHPEHDRDVSSHEERGTGHPRRCPSHAEVRREPAQLQMVVYILKRPGLVPRRSDHLHTDC